MELEDQEFEKLLEEIPQALDCSVNVEDLIEKSATIVSNQKLSSKDVAASIHGDIFPDLFQAFHPVHELGSHKEEAGSYIPPLPGLLSRHPSHQKTHAYRQEEDSLNTYRFTHSHASDVPCVSLMDSSLPAAFTNMDLQGEADACLLKIPMVGDGGETCMDWLDNLDKFHPTAGGITALAERMHDDALGLELPGCRGSEINGSLTDRSCMSASFWNADSFLSGRSSHMTYPNAGVLEGRVVSFPHGNMSETGTHVSCGGLGYGVGLHQGLERQSVPVVPGNYLNSLVSPGMVNNKGAPGGDFPMASYLQAHESPTNQHLRQLREEDAKPWLEKCGSAGMPNMNLPPIYARKDHGYDYSSVGVSYGRRLQPQQHSLLRCGAPQSEDVCMLCWQGICNGVGNPSYHLKQKGLGWNKDFHLHSSPYVDMLHDASSLTPQDEKDLSHPVKILSRKSSRIAPPLNPTLGWLDELHYQAALENGLLDCHGRLARPNVDLLRYNPYHPSQSMQPPAVCSSLEEVEGQILSLAKDQHGCRLLQKKFDEGAIGDVRKIFSEIIGHAVELMVDPFGNYLIQKLLDVCTDEQRMELLKAMTSNGELIKISLNMHGTRAVQKLVETLSSSEQVATFTASLRPGVVSLIKDLNGNHVIQRCLQHLSNEDNEFIFEAAACHCLEIATHRHGCCVLQRCIDHSTGLSRQRLILEIATNSLLLAQDPFGNYVVQYILELDVAWAIEKVLSHLSNNYTSLSMQKSSSNVVEKCLKLAPDEGRARIVEELMDSCHLPQLLQHPYANYVIQSALMVSKGALYTSLVEAIRPHVPLLRSNPYGKRILSRRGFKKF